jgi:tetratricopeptide (TPR) repeat protein
MVAKFRKLLDSALLRSDLWSKNDWDGIIADANKQLLLEDFGPEQAARIYAIRGHAWAKKGNLEKALTDFSKAIELDPGEVAHYRDRARIFAGKGDIGAALSDIEKAFELKPDHYDTYATRGRIYLQNKEFENAIQDFSREVEVAPHFTDALKMRAEAYRALGNIELAEQDEKIYDEALRKAKAEAEKAKEQFDELLETEWLGQESS